jgi:hypothetical protein
MMAGVKLRVISAVAKKVRRGFASKPLKLPVVSAGELQYDMFLGSATHG